MPPKVGNYRAVQHLSLVLRFQYVRCTGGDLEEFRNSSVALYSDSCYEFQNPIEAFIERLEDFVEGVRAHV